MNRRQFHVQLAAAVAAGGLALIPAKQVRAHVVADPSTQRSYRYRLRYARKQNAFSFWMRVSDPKRLDSDVPVSLTLSTDVQGLNVVHRRSTIARAIDSHIVRIQVLHIDPTLWTPGSPLHAQLALGVNGTPSKVWKLYKA